VILYLQETALAMIEIDGSYGEGGGQILRTALSLSCLYQKPFRIFNIRKGRRKPGLMPQHVTSVKAAQQISSADVRGNHPGSTELVFSPGGVKAGNFVFDIGSAGSTMLVLQTLAPPLIFAKKMSSITLKGGTHVPFSPSYHYVAEVFVPLLGRIGPEIRLSIESYGFYPKGGGKITAELIPIKRLGPLRVSERGRISSLKGFSGVGNLPHSVAERQRNALMERLYSGEVKPGCTTAVEVMNVPTPGQGTFIFLKAEAENSIAGFTALGERGKKAELVGEEAATEFLQYYERGVALDPYLADQIVLYLSLCEEESFFTTSRITRHLNTNLWVIGLFHEFRYSVEGDLGKPGKIVTG
jgi:RNA 3'-terminal phosphate cyclase (ATP)